MGVPIVLWNWLSHCAFDLHQLDMCRVVASEKVINEFLETSKKSNRSIGFHNTPLSSSTLCRMLDVPRSTPCRVADCASQVRHVPTFHEHARPTGMTRIHSGYSSDAVNELVLTLPPSNW